MTMTKKKNTKTEALMRTRLSIVVGCVALLAVLAVVMGLSGDGDSA